MFENERNKAYLVYKGINSLIFTNDFKSDFELVTCVFNLDTFGSLCMIETIITNYRDIIDDKMRDNIGRLINYYRYDVDNYSEEEIEKVPEICNNIILHINNSSKRVLYGYVGTELKSRGFCFEKIYTGVQKKNLEMSFNKIKLYNVIDFYLLCALSDLFPDSDYDFYKKYLSDPNVPAIYCITGMINEFPELLCNENFRNRLKGSVGLIKESLDKADDITVSKKQLKKEYKKYKHLISKVCI